MAADQYYLKTLANAGNGCARVFQLLKHLLAVEGFIEAILVSVYFECKSYDTIPDHITYIVRYVSHRNERGIGGQCNIGDRQNPNQLYKASGNYTY
jgi:hypothetical protein